MENEAIVERIKQIMKERKLSQNEFSACIKIDRSNLSKHLNGKLPISDSLCNKIVITFSISKEWLLTGHGEQRCAELRQHSKLLSISPEELIISKSSNQGAQVYDIDVTAGSKGRGLEFTKDKVIGYIDLPNIDYRSYVVKVSGESMSPIIQNGDMLAIREVRSSGYIVWGQIYVVVLEDYRLVKYLRRHSDANWVILRSANQEYDDMEIERSKIRKLFIVENIIHVDTQI